MLLFYVLFYIWCVSCDFRKIGLTKEKQELAESIGFGWTRWVVLTCSVCCHRLLMGEFVRFYSRWQSVDKYIVVKKCFKKSKCQAVCYIDELEVIGVDYGTKEKLPNFC